MLHCLCSSVQRGYKSFLTIKKDTLKKTKKTLAKYFTLKQNVVAQRLYRVSQKEGYPLKSSVSAAC